MWNFSFDSRRMIHRPVKLAAWFSLALFAGSLLLWARSLFAQDAVQFTVFDHFCILSSYPHHLHVLVQRDNYAHDAPLDAIFGSTPLSPRLEFLEIQIARTPTTLRIWLPYWLPVLLFLPLPLWYFARALHHRRRIAHNLCLMCGYDLRATPDRCPECGRPTSPLKTAHARS